MKKKIKDCTFKEFTGWANARACDGRWSMLDAMNSISVISMVYEVKPLFFRGRVREALWRKLRDQYLNMEAEIEIISMRRVRNFTQKERSAVIQVFTLASIR